MHVEQYGMGLDCRFGIVVGCLGGRCGLRGCAVTGQDILREGGYRIVVLWRKARVGRSNW